VCAILHHLSRGQQGVVFGYYVHSGDVLGCHGRSAKVGNVDRPEVLAVDLHKEPRSREFQNMPFLVGDGV
jgi:hypothetical protein